MNTRFTKNPFSIRNTKKHEVDEILDIYNSARLFMIEKGNPDQWLKGYPQKEVILSDIKYSRHFVCTEDHKILGSFALIEGKDPTYQKIEHGKWLNNLPYATFGTKMVTLRNSVRLKQLFLRSKRAV